MRVGSKYEMSIAGARRAAPPTSVERAMFHVGDAALGVPGNALFFVVKSCDPAMPLIS